MRFRLFSGQRQVAGLFWQRAGCPAGLVAVPLLEAEEHGTGTCRSQERLHAGQHGVLQDPAGHRTQGRVPLRGTSSQPPGSLGVPLRDPGKQPVSIITQAVGGGAALTGSWYRCRVTRVLSALVLGRPISSCSVSNVRRFLPLARKP